MVALLGFKNVLDKIWHNGLLHKLIQPKIPNFLIKIKTPSYYVRKNSSKSKIKEIIVGVSQRTLIITIAFYHTHR